jgi:hypothetical protein
LGSVTEGKHWRRSQGQGVGPDHTERLSAPFPSSPSNIERIPVTFVPIESRSTSRAPHPPKSPLRMPPPNPWVPASPRFRNQEKRSDRAGPNSQKDRWVGMIRCGLKTKDSSESESVLIRADVKNVMKQLRSFVRTFGFCPCRTLSVHRKSSEKLVVGLACTCSS